MNPIRVEPSELEAFVRELLGAYGVDESESRVIAHALLWNDLVGRETQGCWRLPAFLKRLTANLVNYPCNPVLTRKADSVALLDGNNGFGYYVVTLRLITPRIWPKTQASAFAVFETATILGAVHTSSI